MGSRTTIRIYFCHKWPVVGASNVWKCVCVCVTHLPEVRQCLVVGAEGVEHPLKALLQAVGLLLQALWIKEGGGQRHEFSQGGPMQDTGAI